MKNTIKTYSHQPSFGATEEHHIKLFSEESHEKTKNLDSMSNVDPAYLRTLPDENFEDHTAQFNIL